jgi:bifunctional DNA-binding transcriptional regulator/antitoxin component of YhaV-PrlF toxin-antitoxin module
MVAGSSADIDTVVTAAGDLVVPSEVVQQLSLVPGQRVRVTISAVGHRRNMYGALSGQLPDVGADEIATERREVWGDLADSQ